MELQVYYSGGTINEKIDKAIEKALKPFGLRRWASGYCLIGEERDLAFTDKKKIKNVKED